MESFFYDAESKEVPGEKGCYTSRAWNKGDVLERIVLDNVLHNIMHIDDFIPLSGKETSKYCYRFSGDLVHYSQEKRLITDYINHSNCPNVLIYMGCTLALRDISPGEEILADYRFLMHECFEMDCGGYSVRGLPGADADREFLRMCAELKA
ncbi:MAG: SET domain-containing protein-lysine N-methyltransferase [Spirochaetota bacterium]